MRLTVEDVLATVPIQRRRPVLDLSGLDQFMEYLGRATAESDADNSRAYAELALIEATQFINSLVDIKGHPRYIMGCTN